MVIAGVDVPDDTVLEVAARLRENGHHETAFRLERAVYAAKPEYALSSAEREEVLDALDDELAPLSSVPTALAMLARPVDRLTRL